MKRNISLELLDDADNLTTDELAALSDELADRLNELNQRKRLLDEELARRYPVPASFMGTERRDDGDWQVKIEVPKKVDWDTDVLIQACNALEEAGEDPREFVEFAPKVRETVYKSIPERFRRLLEPARTITPGKPKISLIRKEAA